MTALFVSILLLQAPQTDAGWDDVRAIPEGAAIKLVMKGGTVEGAFVAATDASLVIHLKKGNYAVDRASIKRLDRRLSGSNRGRNTDLGVGLGIVAGAIRGLFDRDATGVGKTMDLMPFMLVGAIAGSTAPAVRWETVYKTQSSLST
jgi:hypothetical protein